MSDDPAALYLRMRTAIEAHMPMPADVHNWLLDGCYRYERGAPLEHALGLNAKSGAAWRHPVRQLRRSRLEGLILIAAAHTRARRPWSDNRIASHIAAELAGKTSNLPAAAYDFLRVIKREFDPGEYPSSRTRMMRVLTGETCAQRDGLVRSCRAIRTFEKPCQHPEYGNTASNLALRRNR